MSPGGANPLTSPVLVQAGARRDQAFALLVEREELLVLDALDHREDAPGHVVVDGRHLSRLPDEGDDRERPVGCNMERIALVALRVAAALLGGEHVG